MILWGPPGVGKTTLALLVAQSFEAQGLVQPGQSATRELTAFFGPKSADILKAIDGAPLETQKVIVAEIQSWEKNLCAASVFAKMIMPLVSLSKR